MNKYKFNTHCPLGDTFRAGSRIFRKMMQSTTHCMYEVTDENEGLPYTVYELFELRPFKGKKKGFKSSVIKEGEYCYPTENEFGYWAWYYNDKEYALKEWNKKHSF